MAKNNRNNKICKKVLWFSSQGYFISFTANIPTTIENFKILFEIYQCWWLFVYLVVTFALCFWPYKPGIIPVLHANCTKGNFYFPAAEVLVVLYFWLQNYVCTTAQCAPNWWKRSVRCILGARMYQIVPSVYLVVRPAWLRGSCQHTFCFLCPNILLPLFVPIF